MRNAKVGMRIDLFKMRNAKVGMRIDTLKMPINLVQMGTNTSAIELPISEFTKNPKSKFQNPKLNATFAA